MSTAASNRVRSHRTVRSNQVCTIFTPDPPKNVHPMYVQGAKRGQNSSRSFKPAERWTKATSWGRSHRFWAKGLSSQTSSSNQMQSQRSRERKANTQHTICFKHVHVVFKGIPLYVIYSIQYKHRKEEQREHWQLRYYRTFLSINLSQHQEPKNSIAQTRVQLVG